LAMARLAKVADTSAWSRHCRPRLLSHDDHSNNPQRGGRRSAVNYSASRLCWQQDYSNHSTNFYAVSLTPRWPTRRRRERRTCSIGPQSCA
jgi:hypothetical protein